MIAAGLHDDLFQQGHLPLTGTFWMPCVMPFALGLYALVLLNRFVGAIGQVAAAGHAGQFAPCSSSNC